MSFCGSKTISVQFFTTYFLDRVLFPHFLLLFFWLKLLSDVFMCHSAGSLKVILVIRISGCSGFSARSLCILVNAFSILKVVAVNQLLSMLSLGAWKNHKYYVRFSPAIIFHHSKPQSKSDSQISANTPKLP